ncbi:nitrite reductase small subunit [Desmospora sp. 8437]|nr:nitrite reductase small subunit [Desmospora sp. 8437]
MSKEKIFVGSLEELQKTGVKLVKGENHGIAVFYHEDEVFAVDNRCPHMGFPLHQEPVRRDSHLPLASCPV